MEQYTSDKLRVVVHTDTDCTNGKHLVHLVTSVGGLKPVSTARIDYPGMTTVEKDWVESTICVCLCICLSVCL